MLVECGFVRAQVSDGREWTFRPSLARIAALGSPHEIVRLFAELHGDRAAPAAAYVLAVLCDQDDATPLTGWVEPGATPQAPPIWATGEMPADEQIIMARHLMLHGIAGKAKPGRPGRDGGAYSDRFDASEYVSLARAHLGLSSADAEALSMTELQQMLDIKFPDAKAAATDIPSREEYEAGMAAMRAIQAAKGARGG